MTICLKTSSAGSASEGFSDIHAETARMSGITNRVLRPVPDAEARKPIRGRHNLRYAIEKPWVETRGFSIAGGWDWSDVEVQVVFYGGFEFLLLDADVALGYGGAAVLQELLDQGHVIAVGLVDLRGEEFPETVGADALVAEEVADMLQMLLNLALREREKWLVLPDAVVLAVDPDPLIQREGDGKFPLLPSFLLRDGQEERLPSFTIPLKQIIRRWRIPNSSISVRKNSLTHSTKCIP